MANVCKERSLRLQLLHNAHRVFYRRMRGMGLVPQRIQEQNVQLLQLGKRRLRNGAEIGEVRGGPEAIPVDFSIAMKNLYRLEAGAIQLHRASHGVHLHLRHGAVLVPVVKNVAEHAAQDSGHSIAGIERNAPFPVKAERAQVVESKDMVGMGVRIEYRVQLAHTLPQRLLAEIGGGINQDYAPAVLDKNRRASAAVVRIGRSA